MQDFEWPRGAHREARQNSGWSQSPEFGRDGGGVLIWNCEMKPSTILACGERLKQADLQAAIARDSRMFGHATPT